MIWYGVQNEKMEVEIVGEECKRKIKNNIGMKGK